MLVTNAAMYGRLELFDNTRRISHAAESNYRHLLDSGINKSELERLNRFLESYKIRKKRFHGDSWIRILQNQKTPTIRHVKNIVNIFS